MPVSHVRLGYYDIRFLLLCAVFRGADYSYLASEYIRGRCQVPALRQSVYRWLVGMERDGLLVSILDSDVGFGDEWKRRIFRLTGRGRLLLRDLSCLYSALGPGGSDG